MSVTIRDVAKLAGVSASTVSRVINKSAPISEETTGRIYRAMEELKYVPNDIARSFASGSARAIAIAVNASDTRSYANRFFNNTVFAIETAAHRRGYNFIITSANDGRGGVEQVGAVDVEFGAEEEHGHGHAKEHATHQAVYEQEDIVGARAQQVARLAAVFIRHSLDYKAEKDYHPQPVGTAEAGGVEQREGGEECAAKHYKHCKRQFPFAPE